MNTNWIAITEEVSKINALVMGATQRGLAIGFCDFSGHVNKVYVRIFPVGSSWAKGEPCPGAIFKREALADSDKDLPKLRFIRHELEYLLAECEVKGEAL